MDRNTKTHIKFVNRYFAEGSKQLHFVLCIKKKILTARHKMMYDLI